MNQQILKHIIWVSLISLLLMQNISAQPNNNRRRPVANADADDIYISPEQEIEVLEYIKQAYPFKYEDIKRMKKSLPNVYRKTLVRAYREMQFSQRIKEEDPERFENLKKERQLETKSHELADQYKNTNNQESKAAIKEELEQVLEDAFEIRQQNREFEIRSLQKKLEDLMNDNEARMNQKDQIIEKRLNELLGTSDLKW